MNFFYLSIVVLPFFIGIFMTFTVFVFSAKSLYFGVRLPIDFKVTDEMKGIKRSYERSSLISSIIVFLITSAIYFLLPEEFAIGAGIISIFVYMVVWGVCFSKANSKIKHIKKRDKWTGYSKNIVVVDLNHKKDLKPNENIPKVVLLIPIIITVITFIIGLYLYIKTKNELVPGVFGENGQVIEYVKRGDITSIWNYFTPVIVQVILLIIIYMSYIGIIKSKQTINGGDIESIKQYNNKLKNATIYSTVIISVVSGIFFMGMYFINNENIVLASTILVLVLIIFIVLSTIYYQKYINQYRNNYEVKDGKAQINRDDDENFIWGLFYNNPDDPSLFVQKRIGAGYDFNYGNIKVKIGMSILTVVLIGVLGFTAFVLPFNLGDRTPEFTSDSIKIEGLYGETIDKNNISNITLEKSLPKNLERTNGAALETKLLGSFKEDKIYNAKLYVANSRSEVIKILKKDSSIVYINHKDKESTEKLYMNLKNYIKN